MTENIMSVRYGILIGLICLLFGIGWAIWLVVGHEKIHESIDNRLSLASTEKSSGKEGVIHHSASEVSNLDSDHHNGHSHGSIDTASALQYVTGEHSMGGDQHDNPVAELSHTRLMRGHLHAMGLGMLTIMLSIVLAFTSTNYIVKISIPVFVGIGGLIYPIAWIVMGYLTPTLGPDAAERYVAVIAKPSVSIVLLGILLTFILLAKDIVLRRNVHIGINS